MIAQLQLSEGVDTDSEYKIFWFLSKPTRLNARVIQAADEMRNVLTRL